MEGVEITSLSLADISDESQILIYENNIFKKTTIANAKEHIGVSLRSFDVTVEEKPTGSQPVATVTTTGTTAQKDIDLAIGIPKANGIKTVTQTVKSTTDGNYNEVTITQDNGTVSKIQVKNGEKGEKGESGITAPVTGFFSISVNDEGHLIVTTAEATATTCPLSIVDGHLIYTI